MLSAVLASTADKVEDFQVGYENDYFTTMSNKGIMRAEIREG